MEDIKSENQENIGKKVEKFAEHIGKKTILAAGIAKDKTKEVAGLTGKKVKEVSIKAKDGVVEKLDVNADGKLDSRDFSMISNSVGNAVKNCAHSLKETAEEKKRDIEFKTLQPIFLENLRDSRFVISKFIIVSDRNRKYVESEVCKESIGFFSDQKGMRIVNIFRDSIDKFELLFYPDNESEFYYVDPSDKNKYIALDEYFSYLKQVRISELQRIAQDLGAKYFKVTYKEEKVSFSKKKINVKGDKELSIAAEYKKDSSDKQFSMTEIAAEMKCLGHKPENPTLKYMKYDPSIIGLIEMRMNEKTPLLHQKFMLKLSNSSGMKENEAAKIDAVLKTLKCSGNATVVNEVQNESRRYLEYEIDF